MEQADEHLVVAVQQETQDYWSTWYRFSSWFRYPHISPLKRVVQTLKEYRIPRRSEQRVLEFGFGHGHALFWFKPPTRIFGIELSEQAVVAARKRARRKRYSEFRFEQVSVTASTKIDFPSAFFDLVISSHTLEHVWDDQALLDEFYRVLKPGGRLLVVVPHDLDHSQILADPSTRRNRHFPASSYHVHNYNMETLAHLVRRSRFQIEIAERFDAVSRWRSRWPRAVTVAVSGAMSILPYSMFRLLDAMATKAGYPGMQALVFGMKADTQRR